MIAQTFRPFRVETMNPIAQRLAVHAAKLRRFSPILPLAHRRQRQQPTTLIASFDRLASRRSSAAE